MQRSRQHINPTRRAKVAGIGGLVTVATQKFAFAPASKRTLSAASHPKASCFLVKTFAHLLSPSLPIVLSFSFCSNLVSGRLLFDTMMRSTASCLVLVACLLEGAGAFTPAGMFAQTRRTTSSLLSGRSMQPLSSWSAVPRRHSSQLRMAEVAAQPKANYDEIGWFSDFHLSCLVYMVKMVYCT